MTISLSCKRVPMVATQERGGRDAALVLHLKDASYKPEQIIVVDDDRAI